MPTLMIPGPVELEPEVLAVMAQPVAAHYGADWAAVHNETVQLLQQVCATDGAVYLLPGSGSLAVEACIHSAFQPGETVILGDNGWFGQRLTEILTANGVQIVAIKSDARRPLNPDDFAYALRKHPHASGVALVHLETSTGVLNPVEEIAALVRQHSDTLLMMVDSVTGLAGAPFDMDAWGIDLCASASQKALGAPPGVGIAALSSRAAAHIAARPPLEALPRSWYLDLRRWQHYADEWASWHPFPVTMPTSVVLALRESLRRLTAQGVEARLDRYRALAKRLRDGVADLGMELFVPEALLSPIITPVFCPPGMSSPDLRDAVLRDYDILITTGFGAYRERVIRIGHMGGAVSEAHIDRLLLALRQIVGVSA